MKHSCELCGRFTKRIREAVGLPLSTGFPPDKPWIASTHPYAPFGCGNHDEKFNRVQYDLVEFDWFNWEGS